MPSPARSPAPRPPAFATADTRPDPAARSALGRQARERAPRSGHADWQPAADRPDPVKLLLDQARGRVPELLALRYGGMLGSPFSFYRGAAAIMAADLAPTPVSGLHAQLCGDAHLSNFGSFDSPERDLVFDVSDFDETFVGPWEWDVKRLAASVCIAGRDRDFKRAQITEAVLGTVAAYRGAMSAFARRGNRAVWYSHADVDDISRLVRGGVDAKRYKALQRDLEDGRKRGSSTAQIGKLTRTSGGRVGFLHKPPLLVPIDDLFAGGERDIAEANAIGLLGAYRDNLPPDRRALLDGYGYVTMARKVVGVGSVGMRDWVILLSGRDSGDPLLLQVKEATTCVLEPYLDSPSPAHQGERVVRGQRLMQAASDTFLGWLTARGPDGGLRGRRRDYYVRQLADGKSEIDVRVLRAPGLVAYGRLCGWTLARAHARSGDRIAIAGYLGRGAAFDRAIAAFAERYADQNAADYETLRAAVAAGRVAAAREADT